MPFDKKRKENSLRRIVPIVSRIYPQDFLVSFTGTFILVKFFTPLRHLAAISSLNTLDL
jgi:hypothetical protein